MYENVLRKLETELLVRLSMGNMSALDAKYHSKCLLALCNTAKASVDAGKKTAEEDVVSRIALAQLVLYNEKTHMEEGTAQSSDLLI